MTMTLLHGSFEWLIAGGLAFVGLMFLGFKIVKFKFHEIAISLFVWYVVYKLHGNNTAVGAMTATVAALLFDSIGLPILMAFKRWSK